MEKYVVTISRQFYSMGRTIAKKMSEELGIPFYDRDLVLEAAERLNRPVSEISDAEERGPSMFAGHHYPLGLEMLSLKQETFYTQANIIRDLAERESCIIVGRCADSILKDKERRLSIFVYAPYEKRLENCMAGLNLDQKTAVRMIADVDKARAQYCKHFGGETSTVFDYRDLMIDSSRFGTDKTAQILCNVVRDLFY